MVISLKILVLGEKGVGKTSIISQYTTGYSDKTHIVTIGAEFSIKEYKAKNNKEYRLSIWNGSAYVNLSSILDGFYKDANAAMIVFSFADQNSFGSIANWIEKLNEKCPLIPIILVGNKSDLESSEIVSQEFATKTAENFNIPLFKTSVKLNSNISELFEYIAEKAIERMPNI